MRTQKEIERRAKKQYKQDNTGFEWTMYIDYLSYDRAKRIVPTLPKDEWQKAHDFVTSTPIIKQMRDYLPFAAKKAMEGRGMSAQRSLRHYVAWFWLMGHDDMANAIEKYLMESYNNYGKDMLHTISEVLKQHPELEASNDEG